MSNSHYLQLAGERQTLQRMLDNTPTEDVLDRGSLLARLEEVEFELAQVHAPEKEPVRARLTFNGRPVLGSHGVFADFAAKAVGGFSEAVAAIAASFSAPLASRGPIPNRGSNQLVITGTALGSFGFMLEEYPGHSIGANDDPSDLELAIDYTQRLFYGVVSGDNELLADAVAEIDPRALDKVRSFMDVLAENSAVCSLVVRDSEVRFSDVEQVQHGLKLIAVDNIREEKLVVGGVFQGVLPAKRNFEFKPSDGDVIFGKIGASVFYPEIINEHLQELVTCSFEVTRIGEGKPRYLLNALPRWPGEMLGNSG